jgi:hypothetical protein
MDERKRIELKKLDDDGTGLAQIATLSAVDHDGDTYAAGAFGKQDVIILAGHSWDGVPLGKGRVYEKGDHAFAEFKLNLDTVAGKDWHRALKFDMDPTNGKPLTEWSYGYKVLESSEEVRDGKAVRVLEKLAVHEVSPVVKGAGVGTHTVAMKSRPEFLTDADALIEFAERLASERKAEGVPFRQAWLMQLKAINARLEHLLKDVTTIEDQGDPAEAERLLAEFTAIRYGTRTDGAIK